MFCPFIKEECRLDCAFISDDLSCELLESANATKMNTEEQLAAYENIDAKLNDVLEKLDAITRHLSKTL